MGPLSAPPGDAATDAAFSHRHRRTDRVLALDRTVKYFFVTTAAALRYLWYCFYLPMLFIPLFAVFVAAAQGKPEDYRLPRWTQLLYVPAGALFLLVLTNDLHQAVFAFDPL